jgi:hypothetical protein
MSELQLSLYKIIVVIESGIDTKTPGLVVKSLYDKFVAGLLFENKVAILETFTLS